MRRFLSIVASLFVTLSVVANNDLVVSLIDGTTATYDLSSMPNVVMSNDTLSITSSTLDAKYALYKVKKFNFTDATAINSVAVSPVIISNNDKIVLSSANDVRVYTEDGKSVETNLSNESGHTVIDISRLSKGMYVIKADGLSFKIMKK